jgi:hypothetical protein
MMKAKTTLLALAIGAPALISFTIPRDTISFAPKAGSSVAKTFVMKGEIEMDDMSFLMNGEDPGMTPDMEMTTTWEQTVSVTDEYTSMADGHPKKLSRSFDSIGQEIEVSTSVDMMGSVEDSDISGEGTSELEGKTVIFAWNADDEEFTASYPEGEDGDDDLLEGLDEDMDLRVLLPDGDVSEGDEWDLDLSGLTTLLAPGGNLHLDIEMDGEEASMGGPDPSMMSNLGEIMGELEGEATGTYAGTREVDGVKLAVVKIKLDINTARDMTDMIEEMMGEGMPEGIEMSLDRGDIELTCEGEGTLLWNVGAGHAYSLESEFEMTMSMDVEMSMNMGEEITIEVSTEMSGMIGLGLTTE